MEQAQRISVVLCTYQCQAAGGGGGGGTQSGILIDRFGPGVGIFEFLFVPVTTNHFPGWGIQLYLTSHFCPGVGNLTAIFWKMSKSRPLPRLHPRRLDNCISLTMWRLASTDNALAKNVAVYKSLSGKILRKPRRINSLLNTWSCFLP